MPEGATPDYVGAMFMGSWWGQAEPPARDMVEVVNPPPLNEEYFEWIDLLNAVDDARGSFTMVELGAGFGRWAIRGALAARQRGLTTRIVLVEAEPQHALWIRDALALNGLSGDLVEAAIAYDGEPVPFAISGVWGEEQKELHATNWYGQARLSGQGDETAESYFGHRIYMNDGWGQILVPAVTLEEVLEPLRFVDLIDADLQGAEKEMILNSMSVLNEKVRRIHIGTHSTEIEELGRQAFSAAGWTNVWDFSLQGESDTPYGRSNFGDGVQSWINPRLSRAS